MLFNLKKSLPYLGGLLGAVLLATAAFVGGMWYKGQLVPQSQSQTEQETCKDCITPFPAPDTSGWKTYRNEELGFEVKYPETAEVENLGLIKGSNMTEIKDPVIDRSLFVIHKIDNLSGEDYVYWPDFLMEPNFIQYTIAGIEGRRRIDPVGGVRDFSRGPQSLYYGFVEYGVDYQDDFWIIIFYNTSPELYIYPPNSGLQRQRQDRFESYRIEA